jgi:nucleoside 2-deoxyribosyltransferase
MASRPVVYLAGPEVFLPDADEIGMRKIAICAAHGLDARYPVEPIRALGDLSALSGEERAVRFFDALVEQLDTCAAVLANLTPFRGPSADVGTAWEVGYAYGRGVPVFAYTNALDHYFTRVTPDGLFIEDFDLADNLMLEGASRRSGGSVVRVDGGSDPVDRLRKVHGFEACVRRAATHFESGAAGGHHPAA